MILNREYISITELINRKMYIIQYSIKPMYFVANKDVKIQIIPQFPINIYTFCSDTNAL